MKQVKCLVLLLQFLVLHSDEPGIFKRPGGHHPFSGWRNWEQMNLAVSYFNLEAREESLTLWFGASFGGKDSVIRLDGRSPADLNRPPPQFNSRVVKGYDLPLDGLDFPLLSRVNGLRIRDGTQLVQGSIGPRYTGGGSELFPALFLKKPGGDWIHSGPPSGEPEALLNQVRQLNAQVRSEGGGLIELPDGRLRVYLHGLPDPDGLPDAVPNSRLHVHTLLVAESERPEGPWNFLRNADGSVINLLATVREPWTFLHVQPLGDIGFILTGADAWPPTRIFAAYSRDGLHFVSPAHTGSLDLLPLMRMEDVAMDAKFCKALRGVLHPNEKTFSAVMNVSRPADRGFSMLYHSQARFQPETFKSLFHHDNKTPHLHPGSPTP